MTLLWLKSSTGGLASPIVFPGEVRPVKEDFLTTTRHTLPARKYLGEFGNTQTPKNKHVLVREGEQTKNFKTKKLKYLVGEGSRIAITT